MRTNPLRQLIRLIGELLSWYIGLYLDNFHKYGLIAGFFVNVVLLGITITIFFTLQYIYRCIHDSPNKVGARYEELVSNVIKKHLKTKTLHSLLLPCDFTPLKKTEADMVFINQKGVFCCECKHRSFNDLEHVPYIKLMSDTWVLDPQNGISLHNPFIQNKTHIAALADNVPLSAKGIYNMVIVNFEWTFSHLGLEFRSFENKGLAPLEGEGSFLLKINKEYLFRFVTKMLDPGIITFKNHLESMPDIYTAAEVEQLYTELKKYEATKKQLRQFKKDQERLQFEEEYQQYWERERQKDMLKKMKKNRK